MGYPSRQKEEKDYAENAIVAGKDGNKKASAFDKKKLTELSAGEAVGKQTTKQKQNLNPIIVKAIAAKKGAPKQTKSDPAGQDKTSRRASGDKPIKPKRTKSQRRPIGINRAEDERREKERKRKNQMAAPGKKEDKTKRAPKKKEKVKTTYDKKGRLINARTGEFLGGRRKETKPKLTPRSKDSNPPKMKGVYMESNAQEKKNLLTVQSWMSKFSQSRM